MKIHGFQKMTLLDFPGKVACTLFTAGCNLRCPFCHNAPLVTDIDNSLQYTENDIFAYLQKRKGLLDGVVITGGEPLLQLDIASFIKKIKNLGYDVKLDTNGSFPDKLYELISEGLIDYVAVDIKNCREKYALTTGIENYNLENIDKTVNILKQGNIPYEFRTTVVKEFHTVEDIEKIGDWICGADKYYLQSFVDSGNLIGSDLHPVDADVMKIMAKKVQKCVSIVGVRGI